MNAASERRAPLGRVMAVDYGSRRVGVAICDELGITTRPLTTLDRKVVADLPGAVAALAEEHGVRCIVVGLPVHPSGDPGSLAGAARGLAKAILKATADAPAGPPSVYLFDESYTSADAAERLRSTGRLATDASGRPEDKGAIDAAAAAVLLEQWLREREGTDDLPGERVEMSDGGSGDEH